MELSRSSLMKTRCLRKQKKPEMPTPDFPIQEKWGIVNSDASNPQRTLRMVQESKLVGISLSYIQASWGLLSWGLRGHQSGCFRSFRPQLGLGKLVPAQLRPNFI